MHHQESITVYKAVGICHTGYADCFLASSPTSRIVFSFHFFFSASRLSSCKPMNLVTDVSIYL